MLLPWPDGPSTRSLPRVLELVEEGPEKMSAGKPWLADYEKLGYHRVWEGKRLEDASQKHIIRSWLTDSDRCLELGCGFGRVTELLEARFREVFALEYALKNLASSRKRLNNAQLARADISKIPARDSAFDCVVMIRVIHLLPDPKAVLEEVSRVAKDGATVTISVPNLAMNNVLWAVRKIHQQEPALGPFVWPFGTNPHFVRPRDFAPESFELVARKGTGLFDNPVGPLLERHPWLYLFDVATSPLWFFKLDIFLKFKVRK